MYKVGSIWQQLMRGLSVHAVLCRKNILADGLDCGRMHQLCSSLKGTLKINDLLADAEALCKYAGDAGVDCCATVPQPTAVFKYRADAAVPAQ